MIIKPVYANEIVNKALPDAIRSKTPGQGLAFYISQLWKTAVIVGGLAFLIYLIWGAIEWLTAAGDKNQVETARSKITNALIGLAILVLSFAIVKLVEVVFKINLLNPVFPTAI